MRISKATLLVSFVALVVLVGAVVWLYLGYMRDANRTAYIVRFEDVGGLVAGAGVFYRGLEVGHIANVSFEPSQKWVNVEIKVDADLDLRRNASLHVTTAGLLGEAIMEISDPGGSPERVSAGDVLRGTKLGSFDVGKVVETAGRTVERLDAWLDNLPTAGQLKGIDQRLERVEEKLDRLLAKNTEPRRLR